MKLGLWTGAPPLAPNCEALISKLKRIEREPIRTPRLLSGGVLRMYITREVKRPWH